MSIEANKSVVRAFIDSLCRADPDRSLVAKDAVWWIPGRGHISRDAFFDLAAGVNALFTGPPVMKITAVTAEDDRVAVEAEGRAELKDGRLYENTYHFLFYVRDGLIREAREHNNSAVPAALFGRTLG